MDANKTPKTAAETIDAAARSVHLGTMASSAALRLADARALLARGRHGEAQSAALDSLAYSVGKLHPEYTSAAGTESTADMVARLRAKIEATTLRS